MTFEEFTSNETKLLLKKLETAKGYLNICQSIKINITNVCPQKIRKIGMPLDYLIVVGQYFKGFLNRFEIKFLSGRDRNLLYRTFPIIQRMNSLFTHRKEKDKTNFPICGVYHHGGINLDSCLDEDQIYIDMEDFFKYVFSNKCFGTCLEKCTKLCDWFLKLDGFELEKLEDKIYCFETVANIYRTFSEQYEDVYKTADKDINLFIESKLKEEFLLMEKRLKDTYSWRIEC